MLFHTQLPDQVLKRASSGTFANDGPQNGGMTFLHQPGAGPDRQIKAFVIDQTPAGNNMKPVFREIQRTGFLAPASDSRDVCQIGQRFDFILVRRQVFPEPFCQAVRNRKNMRAFLIADLVVIYPAKIAVMIKAEILLRADALSGSYLANQKNAPILLVKNRNKEINLVKDYIKANLTSGGTVYLLGGVNAVPKAMENGLEGFNVKRLAGATRYETNLEILKEAGISGDDILVCTGLDFADGLSASAVNKPILLVKDSLRATQVNYLKTLGAKNFYLIGGTNAVNKRIESALAAYGTTQRIEGATRYYTSVNIAKTFFPNAKTAVLAYAQNFPDGLSGGCLACSMNAPLILTANGKQAPAVAYAKEAGITGGAVLGGTGLIPDRVANAIFQIS